MTAPATDKLAGRTLIRTVPLPSRGLLYPNLPDGQVRVGAITSREQKIFAGSGSGARSKIDIIIDNCVDSRGLASDDLLLADRLFCLFQVRSLASTKYGFKYRCPACGSINPRVEIDLLQDLHVKELTQQFLEPYRIKLPLSGKSLGLRHFRGKDEQAVADWATKHAGTMPAAEGDIAYYYRLSRHVTEVDGQSIPLGAATVVDLVQHLEGPDVFAFLQALDDMAFGFVLDLTMTCPNSRCRSEEEVGMPFTAEFFRPRISSAGTGAPGNPA